MELSAHLSCFFLAILSVLIRPGHSQEYDTSTLELVQMMYRHGDRTPISFYPNDPYSDPSIWPDGFGQLTKNGKAMQYALGKWLRKRYDGFISKQWIPEEVYVRSTDVDRTLMSAACNLAAFYHPDEPARFHKDLEWLPTPIHTAPLDEDLLLSVDKSCPRIAEEMKHQEELPLVKNVTEQSQELFQYLTEKSGENVTCILDVDYMYDTLKIEAIYNHTLPEWTKDVLPAMKELSDFSFEIVALSEELKRLRAGPIIGEMGKNMKKKAEGKTPKQKMYMYSAHDVTLAQLLLGLGVFNNVAPPYAATVLIELHKVQEERYVKMFLRNDTKMIEPPHELILPGCSSMCRLDDWLNITSNVVPKDWASECHSKKDGTYDMAIETLAATIVAAVLAILLVLLLVFNFIKWRQSQDHFSYQSVPNYA